MGNNPVNSIDKDGAVASKPDNDYGVREDGSIFKIRDTKDDFDMLYAVDANDEVISSIDGVKVLDRGFLPNLSNWTMTNSNKDWIYLYSASTKNFSDASKVFWFGVENSNVEWSFIGAEGHNYSVGNFGMSHKAPNFNTLGINKFNVIFGIHSHPDDGQYIGASGYYGDTYSLGVTDRANITHRYYEFKDARKKLFDHYVYEKGNKVLFKYTPWKGDIYIKEISNYKSFNFLK